jgi:osmoprotectant transport system permease protein
MFGRFTSRDSVALVGSVLGLATVLLSWLSLKPNRLAPGSSMSLWESIDWGPAALLLLLWLACLALSLNIKGRRQAILLGITANLVLAATLLFFGMAASRIIGIEPEFSRVSPGVGIWLTIAAVYVLVFAARQKLPGGDIWRHLLFWVVPAVLATILLSGWLDDISIMVEFAGRSERFFQELWQHIFLFGTSVIIGSVIGIWLGIWATRSRRVERPVFFLANITQTIPSLALFGLLIAPLSALSLAFPFLCELGIRGIGTTPALIALVIYSLLPIMRNTFVGLRQVDPAAIDAGLGMGMSRRQLFRRVEMPLAAPLVAEGVRIASVQSVGLAAVAALIGAGGLGFFIFQGFGSSTDLILLGALPIIVLALVIDAVMRFAVRLVTPKGMTGVST